MGAACTALKDRESFCLDDMGTRVQAADRQLCRCFPGHQNCPSIVRLEGRC